MPLQAPARAPAAAPHTAVPGPLPVRTSAPGPHGPAPADIGDSGTRLARSFSPTGPGPRPARFVYSRPPCGKGAYFIHVRCHVAASLFCEGAGTVAPASPLFSQSGLQVAQPEALGSNYARASLRSLPDSSVCRAAPYYSDHTCGKQLPLSVSGGRFLWQAGPGQPEPRTLRSLSPRGCLSRNGPASTGRSGQVRSGRPPALASDLTCFC